MLAICIDFIIGCVFTNLYFKVKSGTIFKTNYSIKDCREDILILGASEISHHFKSNLIEDSLGLSCYNLGMDGLTIFYEYPVFREIIKRYKPKIVIISATAMEDDVADIKSLLPYCRKYNSVNSFVIEADPAERYKLLSRSYPYNSQVFRIIQGLIIEEPKTNGYYPLAGSRAYLKLKTAPDKLLTTPKSIDYFTALLTLAKKSGCKVYIVQPPRYQINSIPEDQMLYKTLSEKSEVRFLNYLPDTTFINHPEYFKDNSHLNNTGAELFTRKIIEDLAKDL